MFRLPQLTQRPFVAIRPQNSQTRRNFIGPGDVTYRKSEFIKALKNTYSRIPGKVIDERCAEHVWNGVAAEMRRAIRVIDLQAGAYANRPARTAASDNRSDRDGGAANLAADLGGARHYEKAIQFVNLGLNDDEISTAIKAGIAPENVSDLGSVKELTAMGFTPGYALRCVLSGLNLSKIEQLFTEADIPREMFQAYAEAYSEANLLIAKDTVASRSDAALAADERGGRKLHTLGSGFYNRVYLANYQTSEPGQVEVRVFKPLHSFGVQRLEDWHARMGIDPTDSQFARRNMATRGLAEALGFDVVPKIEIGFHTVLDFSSSGKAVQRLGMLMEQAPGRAPNLDHKGVWNHPEIKRQLTQLQLLDHLTGQFDRHIGNYFVQVEADGDVVKNVKVTGIDNDLCFSPDVAHPNQIWDRFHPGAQLPAVIDVEMADAIENLTPNDVAAKLEGKLSHAEVAAAQTRLSALKDHVRALRSQNCIIAPERWGDDLPKMTSNNSYWAQAPWATAPWPK